MALDSFTKSYNASTFGTPNLDLTSPNELLSLAQQQGGAVAQAANEIAHPTTGILSTIGEGFKKTFRGFVDVISMPGQAVAGVLSSKYSIGEAIKKDISVSDVWFGKPDPKNSTLEKIGSFTVRTAVDILTDPLTYLTFGASGVGKGSIFGIGAIKKVMVGEDAAKAIGGSVAKKFADTGIAEVALNQAGFDVNKYATLLMAQQSGKAIEKTVVNELTGKIEKVLSRSQIGELDNELKMLMKVSLDSELDVDYAAMAVGKLIEKFPQLTETLLDKGGIKFFGNTILESQRIYQTTQLIPGMSMIDHATRPMRQVLSTMFNPAAVKMPDGSTAFVPDELVRMKRSLEELSETTGDAKITQLWNIVKENKLSLEDAKLITASIEANKVMKEPRLENVRKLLQGFSDNEIKFLQESGIPISNLENYFPHILTPEAVAASNKVGFARGGLTQSTHAAKERNVLKYVGQVTGKKFVGYPEKFGLIKKLTAEEESTIINRVNLAVASGEHDIAKLQNEIKGLAQIANDFYKDKMSDNFKKLLSELPIDEQENFKQLMNVLNNEVGSIDVEKLAAKRAKNEYVAGVKKVSEIKQRLSGMSPEALAMLQEKILKGLFALKEDTDKVNDAIKSLLKNPKIKKKSVAKINPDDELAKLAADWKLGASAQTFKYVNENIDRQSLAKVIQSMKNVFEQDPTGIKRILESIIGKKQAITDILSNIDLEKIAAKQDLSELPLDELFYFDKDSGEIFKVLQATVEEAKAAGFDFEDNAILAYAAKSIQNIRSGFSYQYMNAAISFSSSKENAGKGWRTVNLSGIEKMGHRMDALLGKKFEDRYFPPAIATFLEDTISKSLSDPGSKSFLAAYDKIQNYWKASVTSIWPAFNGMNAISNVLQNFLDIGLHALDPVLNSQASAMIYTDRKVFNLERKAMKEGAEGLAAREEMNKILLAPMFTDSTGISWTYGELRQLMQRKGIAFDPNHITGQLDVTTTGRIEKLFDSQDPFIKKAWKEANIFSMDNRIFKTGRHVSQMVEEQARVTNFVANLRATGDPFLAAQRTKMFLFDYGNLTNFEKTFLKRIMPFYTFTRKNLELQVKTLLTTPGRIEAELTGIQNLGDILSGDKKLTEEERAALPEWARYGINVLRDRRNSTVSMYTTLKTPIEQIFAQFQPNTLLGSISPLMRVPLEQLSGYSLYNGKMLSDVTNAAAFKRAPESVKRFIGYTEIKGTYKDGTPFVWYESLRPERMNLLLNLPPTTRVFSSLKQMDAVDVSEQDKILQQLTGIKPFTFDLAKEQAKRDKELAAKLTKLLDNANVVATFSKTYIPKESGY